MFLTPFTLAWSFSLQHARAVRASSSVVNFQFAIFNLQYFLTKGEFFCLMKLLKNENCKLKIDGLRAKPALGQTLPDAIGRHRPQEVPANTNGPQPRLVPVSGFDASSVVSRTCRPWGL